MFGGLFLLLALFGTSLPNPAQKATDDYCFATDENPYLFFCSKTAYEYTHGDLNEDVVPESICHQKESSQQSFNFFFQRALLSSFGV